MEGVAKGEVVCVVSDPSVKLIIVDIGGRALCRRLDSGGFACSEAVVLGEGVRGCGESGTKGGEGGDARSFLQRQV